MKPTTKLYLKAFLLTGLPFASLMLIFEAMQSNPLLLWKFVWNFLFFGILMSVTLVSGHIRQARKAGTDPGLLDVVQKGVAHTSLTPREIAEQIAAHPFFGKAEIEQTADQIVVRTRVSGVSWGEVIRLRCIPENQGHTIHIESRPKLPLTLVDNGKSRKNVEHIRHLLTEEDSVTALAFQN